MKIRGYIVRTNCRIPIHGHVSMVVRSEHTHPETIFKVAAEFAELVFGDLSGDNIAIFSKLSNKTHRAETPTIVNVTVVVTGVVEHTPERVNLRTIIIVH